MFAQDDFESAAANINLLDSLISWRRPLGVGMGQLWWKWRLPALPRRYAGTSRRLANDFDARRIRSHHTIRGIQLPLLERCGLYQTRMVSAMVLHVSLHSHIHRRRQHRHKSHW